MSSASWTGSLTIGKIEIPVSLYGSIKSDDISLKMCCPDHGTEVTQLYHCAEGDHYLTPDLLGRAFKSGEKLLAITKDELNSIGQYPERTITLTESRPIDELPYSMVKGAYHIKPKPGWEKTYLKLDAALWAGNTIAMGRVTMRTHDHICAVAPGGELLLLHWQDQITEGFLGEEHYYAETNINQFMKVLSEIDKTGEPILENYTENRHHAELSALIERKVSESLKPTIRRKIVRRGVRAGA